jgi:hypothetical protein
MHGTFRTWFIGTLVMAITIMGINFILFGFPPEPYGTLLFGRETEHNPDLRIILEGGLSRYVDLFFAPCFGLLYVFHKQGLYKNSDHYGIMFFGLVGFAMMSYFNMAGLTLFFLAVMSAALAIYVRSPQSFQIIITLMVLTGYYTWGASQHGIGIFPWMWYGIMLLLPSVAAYILHTSFKKLDWYETD